MLYPIGIQSFASLRRNGYVYVDKSEFVYKLASTGRYYFLSRPRRFGKSLLLSTFKAYFEGRRELFEGLAIEGLEKDWGEYPVLYLDLNSEDYPKNHKSLDARLHQQLTVWERLYGADASETTFPGRFMGVIQRAYEKTGNGVVILVDEYDKPLAETIDNQDLQDDYRTALKAFYSVLKTQDEYIRFAFLTGVTRFSKVSVFSDLNNLEDISMLPDYAAICGITEEEIHTWFEEPIHELAANAKLTYEQACSELKRQYDGYHFCYGGEGIYNPFSLLNTFKTKMFGSYWFATGTPTMLAQLLMETSYPLGNLGEATATADMLGSIETLHGNPIPIIYQSGYLTILGYDAEFKEYRLGFPNREVEEGFNNALLNYYIPSTKNGSDFSAANFVRAARKGNVEDFMRRLAAMFASIDYSIIGDREIYFHNAVNIFFIAVGLVTDVERHTSDGRIDIVVKAGGYTYVMELELDSTAEAALQQVNSNGYALQYSASECAVYKIGINFSSETRRITEWKYEKS